MPETDAKHSHRAAPSAEIGGGRHPIHTGGPRSYERHRPEETVLYRTVQAHWKTFLSELESAAEPPVLPALVIAEVEAFLRCGILTHGLILAKCRATARGASIWAQLVSFGFEVTGKRLAARRSHLLLRGAFLDSLLGSLGPRLEGAPRFVSHRWRSGRRRRCGRLSLPDAPIKYAAARTTQGA